MKSTFGTHNHHAHPDHVVSYPCQQHSMASLNCRRSLSWSPPDRAMQEMLTTEKLMNGKFDSSGKSCSSLLSQIAQMQAHSALSTARCNTLHEPFPQQFVSEHTTKLASELCTRLRRLTHEDRSSAVQIYRDETSGNRDPSTYGPILSMNVVRADGSYVACGEVQKVIDSQAFSVSSGSILCPRSRASHLDWSHAEMWKAHDFDPKSPSTAQIIVGKPVSVINVSVRVSSSYEDVSAFVAAVRSLVLPQTWQRVERWLEGVHC